jgi:hypothetical protein
MNTLKSANNQANQGSSIAKKTSNITAQGIETYQTSSTMGKVIFFIVVILFLAFLIYIIYSAVVSARNKSDNSPVIVNDVIDAFVSRPAFKLPQVIEGMNQSFSTWIYVKDWNYKFGQYKNILWKGNPSNSGTLSTSPVIANVHCPSLWLYPLTNSLKVVTSTSVPEQVESCDIQNIPLMTWVHIVYVLNNRTVDIYINGKLERSCALRGIPTITNDPVYITSGNPQAGFYGKIGKTQYFTYPLLPNHVANLYQQGPLGSSQYQIQFFRNGKFVSFDHTNNFSK